MFSSLNFYEDRMIHLVNSYWVPDSQSGRETLSKDSLLLISIIDRALSSFFALSSFSMNASSTPFLFSSSLIFTAYQWGLCLRAVLMPTHTCSWRTWLKGPFPRGWKHHLCFMLPCPWLPRRIAPSHISALWAWPEFCLPGWLGGSSNPSEVFELLLSSPWGERNKSCVPSLALGCWAPENCSCRATVWWVMGHDHSAVQSLASKHAHAALFLLCTCGCSLRHFPGAQDGAYFLGVCQFQMLPAFLQRKPAESPWWPNTAGRAGIWWGFWGGGHWPFNP